MDDIQYVVFIKAEKPRHICGQTVGADGCGERIKIIRGDKALCSEKLKSLTEFYESRYSDLEVRVIEQEETFQETRYQF